MHYFSHFFSLNMLSADTFARTTIEVFDFDRLREDCHGDNNSTCEFCHDCTPLMYAKLFLKESYISCVGHEDTANILSTLLETPIPFSRREIFLAPNDELLVAQYIGPRLPGSKFARIKFQKVSIFSKQQLELEARHILRASKSFKVIEILNAD